MTPPPPAPLSETWTPSDEIILQWYAERLSGGYLHNADAVLFARQLLLQREEIERLRAENARHCAYTALIEVEASARDGGWSESGLLAVGNALIANKAELDTLRSELSSLRETPK